MTHSVAGSLVRLLTHSRAGSQGRLVTHSAWLVHKVS